MNLIELYLKIKIKNYIYNIYYIIIEHRPIDI